MARARVVSECGYPRYARYVSVVLYERSVVMLHWARNPWSVSAPVSSVTVVSGKELLPIHGCDGAVLKRSWSSGSLRAPSLSYISNEFGNLIHADKVTTHPIAFLKEIREELDAFTAKLNSRVRRDVQSVFPYQ